MKILKTVFLCIMLCVFLVACAKVPGGTESRDRTHDETSTKTSFPDNETESESKMEETGTDPTEKTNLDEEELLLRPEALGYTYPDLSYKDR